VDIVSSSAAFLQGWFVHDNNFVISVQLSWQLRDEFTSREAVAGDPSDRIFLSTKVLESLSWLRLELVFQVQLSFLFSSLSLLFSSLLFSYAILLSSLFLIFEKVVFSFLLLFSRLFSSLLSSLFSFLVSLLFSCRYGRCFMSWWLLWLVELPIKSLVLQVVLLYRHVVITPIVPSSPWWSYKRVTSDWLTDWLTDSLCLA